ncbi:cytochrome C assembly protein [Bacillus pseudomycoides]|uniref:Cytochrome C assembly protein n=1 Tax=Bacillus pseudomycoides TaxID=64104 RepID=A0AA91ZSP6_9BACI|nr:MULTISPECIES: cytochrome c biogenesis protein CcsA [Bacillus]PEB51609.1 cytochrome C assembly protein [Bacillus sp. AFS098217]PED80843.1 cytochrome C assembly protein [Bacillus pseudomycoides]PEU11376.1 cytochrome C assembly protein [Bacillus sp. AFS014408]PEU17482.1 cytochrome C assembly protein [Bacillus sp. AFS019443]PFW63553.1 cytochrome C assembly protein [Bacillus sp. AFS075034]
MSFLNNSIIYHIAIILYACSISLYFIDYFQSNRKANRLAFWLLSIVWVLQSVFMLLRATESETNPILTLLSGIYFYVWLLITMSLVINRFMRIDFLVFFTNVVAFGVSAFSIFTPIGKMSPILAHQLVSELVYVHVGMAITSYAAFTVSFIFSIMYLLQYRLLKQKKWNARLRRLGNLSKLESMSYGLNLFSVPFFLLAILLGCIWGYTKLDNFHWYDTKVIGSFVVLFVYCAGLYLRGSDTLQGKKIIHWNIGAFLVMLVNIFLLSSLSNFHFWYL